MPLAGVNFTPNWGKICTVNSWLKILVCELDLDALKKHNLAISGRHKKKSMFFTCVGFVSHNLQKNKTKQKKQKTHKGFAVDLRLKEYCFSWFKVYEGE